MSDNDMDLKDCGHVVDLEDREDADDLGGVCHAYGCGQTLCPACLEDCDMCGMRLCPAHQTWLDGGETPFCEPCAQKHIAARLLDGMGGETV